MTFKHLYSVEEAQAALHEIEPLLAELVDLKHECDRKGFDVQRHQYFGGMGPNGQKAFPNEMERLVEIATAFADKGIEIKDLDRGLIDFPYKRANGQVVYLCYLLGEDTIAYWHTIEGGFQGRQPLDSL
jgi:hypothetical protein